MSPKLFAALILAAITVSPALAQTRQQAVRQRSAQVMPFSMDATMHQFEPTKTGGLMVVTVHEGDARQVALVRAHLQKEAAAFARGDYGDPAYIHGKNMPGLASLSAGARLITVHYVQRGAHLGFAPLVRGASLRSRPRRDDVKQLYRGAF